MINQWENVGRLKCPIPPEFNTTQSATLSTIQSSQDHSSLSSSSTSSITSTLISSSTSSPESSSTSSQLFDFLSTSSGFFINEIFDEKSFEEKYNYIRTRPLYCVEDGAEILDDLKIRPVIN